MRPPDHDAHNIGSARWEREVQVLSGCTKGDAMTEECKIICRSTWDRVVGKTGYWNPTWDALEPAPKHTDAEYDTMKEEAIKLEHRLMDAGKIIDELKSQIDLLVRTGVEQSSIINELKAENERLRKRESNPNYHKARCAACGEWMEDCHCHGFREAKR